MEAGWGGDGGKVVNIPHTTYPSFLQTTGSQKYIFGKKCYSPCPYLTPLDYLCVFLTFFDTH